MSKGSGMKQEYLYTQNRELSWLRFNRRVLEEAEDETVPALERLKFISIFSTNLDEFFMIRVGSLFDISDIAPNTIDSKSGMTPAEQLSSIYQVIPGLVERKKMIYASVCSTLEEKGIKDVAYDELRPNEAKFVAAYFNENILPVLSPQIVDMRHPTPHFQNKLLYIASLVRSKNNKKSVAFVPIPEVLPQIVMLPAEGRFIRTENIILQWASTLYGQYKQEEACILSVTRNADVSFDSDKFEDTETDFRNHVKKLLKKRANLSIVRLELGSTVSNSFMKELLQIIEVENHQIYIDTTPLHMKYVFELVSKLPEKLCKPLCYIPYVPKWPADLETNTSVIEQIRQKDRFLFFPFDSVDPFIRLLNEAADRNDVVSVKITIYRLASSSKIVRALCRAAENGKEVVVLMELRARFDEENNIAWSKMLEEAGCKVIYGMENYKCHSKICLITLREKGKYRYITQVGTGNYNEKTNAMYTDLSIMTANEKIGADATAFFRNMLTGNLDGEYTDLLVAPAGIKATLCRLIDEEIAKGTDGYICIKVNSVTERDIIDKLAEASRAGVDIRLIVRGICCIRPGIIDETDHIFVTSIVGRFLEHARIYCFGKGNDARLYLSSADLMTRNLIRRVEIACPVYDDTLKRTLLHILSVQLTDTAKASFLQPDGSYVRKKGAGLLLTDSHQEFMDNPLHEAIPSEKVQKRKGLPLLVRRLFPKFV
ncbi:MAG: polyphosphate kinase 1 [Lachnospiraceae bacterium]